MSIHDRIPEFRSYEDACEGWDASMKWDVFDGVRSNFNIAHECIDRHPENDIAIRIQEDSGEVSVHSFQELQTRSARFANAFGEIGIEPEDPVAVMMEPSLDLYAALFGILKRRGIAVPLSTLYAPDSIRYHIDDSQSELLVTTTEHQSSLTEVYDTDILHVDADSAVIDGQGESFDIPQTAGTDTAIVQYTSGTTGRPTGHLMKHKSLTNMVEHVKFGIGLNEPDHFFSELKPSWAGGIWIGTFGPLMFGNAIGTYAGKFAPATLLAGLSGFEITNWASTPTALRKVMNSGDLPTFDLALDKISVGGEKLDTDTIEYYQTVVGITIANIYGMSEFGAILMNYNGFPDWKHKPGSIGKPKPGIDVAIIDKDGTELPVGQTGEIAVRHEGEWFRTSDRGVVDDEGYFWHKGRIDEVILTAGYRVDPFEVENILLQHDDVADAAVVGIPHSERGEIVKAYVKPHCDPTEGLKSDLAEFVKTTLSRHKYPRNIEFVETFPRTSTGKIRRTDLEEESASSE